MSTADRPRPSLHLSPDDALIDAPLEVGLLGLPAGTAVTLRARVRPTDLHGGWESRASFLADETGAVRLDAQAPVSGSYAGVDPAGLLWSLAPAAGDATGDATGDGAAGPLPAGLAPYAVEVSAEVDGQAVATARALRRPVAAAVTARAVREDGLVANLFLPPGDGPFPTVVVLGGSGGGFADGTAALLASHGYGALSLAYFGVEGLPRELLRIPLEYFARAIAWVGTQSELAGETLAVSGTSRGGELALLLASRHPEIAAVVAYVPSGFGWGAVSSDETPDPGDALPSWTDGGRPVPYVARVRNDDVAAEPDGSLTLTPAFLRHLDDRARADAAAIPVERINGPILLVSGRDDALWPSAAFAELIVERLRRHAFAHPCAHLSYEGAGHAIGPRYVPTASPRGIHPVRGVVTNLGGTPAADARARDDSWPRVLAFLDEHVGAPARRRQASAREPVAT